jgi:Fe-S-cluster-containing hydrogenase component 2
MIIKNFESHSSNGVIDVWCVLVGSEDWRGVNTVKCIGCYTTEMLAADRMIRYINRQYDEEFERFFEDGTRLFASIDENEDYEKCITFCEENHISVYVDNTKLYNNSNEN